MQQDILAPVVSCRKCGGLFPQTAEHFTRRGKGFRATCKTCKNPLNSAAQKRYRERNVAMLADSQRSYRRNHRDEYNARRRLKRLKNLKEIREKERK